MEQTTNIRWPGRLIAWEGNDGAGKSTAVALIKGWLEGQGIPVYLTSWNSSPLVKPITRHFKKNQSLNAAAFSLLHAADLHDRYERIILPHLNAGYVVLADRWIYTALARDTVRGLPQTWVRSLYEFAPDPDLTIFLSLDPATSIHRLRSGRAQVKYYESGQDVSQLDDAWASFLWFQEKTRRVYQMLANNGEIRELDAALPLESQQPLMRQWISNEVLASYKPPLGITAPSLK